MEQVAEQTGIVKSTLSNYENDRKPDVNLNAWKNWQLYIMWIWGIC